MQKSPYKASAFNFPDDTRSIRGPRRHNGHGRRQHRARCRGRTGTRNDRGMGQPGTRPEHDGDSAGSHHHLARRTLIHRGWRSRSREASAGVDALENVPAETFNGPYRTLAVRPGIMLSCLHHVLVSPDNIHYLPPPHGAAGNRQKYQTCQAKIHY